MKLEIELPDEALQVIAAAVADRLRPVILALTAAPAKADELMGVADLTSYLGVSKDWVYQRTAKNEIPFTKAGRLIRFQRAKIDAWISARYVPDISSISAPPSAGGRGMPNRVTRQGHSKTRPKTPRYGEHEGL